MSVIENLHRILALVNELEGMEQSETPPEFNKREASALLGMIFEKIARMVSPGTLSKIFFKSDSNEIYGYMTSPFKGQPKDDILDFIKNQFDRNGINTIEIFDPFFVACPPDNAESYLCFLSKVFAVFEEIKIQKVIVNFNNSQRDVKENIKSLLEKCEFKSELKSSLGKEIHDRFWIGYKKDNSEELRNWKNIEDSASGAVFGSSFNIMFKKPMYYAPLESADIEIFVDSVNELESE